MHPHQPCHCIPHFCTAGSSSPPSLSSCGRRSRQVRGVFPLWPHNFSTHQHDSYRHDIAFIKAMQLAPISRALYFRSKQGSTRLDQCNGSRVCCTAQGRRATSGVSYALCQALFPFNLHMEEDMYDGNRRVDLYLYSRVFLQ